MDLIDEKDIFIMEVGQDSSEVSRTLHRRAGGDSDANPHFGSNDISQGGLPQAWGTIEKDVV